MIDSSLSPTVSSLDDDVHTTLIDSTAAAASSSSPSDVPVASSLPDGGVDDSADPRHQTYVPYLVRACVVVYLLWSAQIIPSLAVVPDTMVTFFNDGVSCNGDLSHTPSCHKANARYTLIAGITSSVGCFITFLGSPMLGVISDAYGRRRPIILCAILIVLQQFTLFAYSWFGLSLYAYFAGTMLATFDATSLVLAYLSDVVPPSRRTIAFGLIFASITGSLVSASFIGNGSISVTACFTTSFVVSLAYLITVIFFLPESLPMESRAKFSTSQLNPFATFKVIARYDMFKRLAMVVFVVALVEQGFFAVLYPFMKIKFGTTELFYSRVAITAGVLGIMTQSVVLAFMVKRFKTHTIIMVGLIAGMLHMTSLSLVNKDWMMFGAALLSSLSFLTFPSISSIKSNNVEANEQGRIQGALYGVRQLGSGIGPLLFSAVFNIFTSDTTSSYYDPSAVWYVGIFVALVAVLLGSTIPNVVSADERKSFEAKLANDKEIAAAEAAIEDEERKKKMLDLSFIGNIDDDDHPFNISIHQPSSLSPSSSASLRHGVISSSSSFNQRDIIVAADGTIIANGADALRRSAMQRQESW